MRRRNSHYKRILNLDPQKDLMEIVHLSGFYEFPFLTSRSLEMAFFRTFAVPSIANLLHHTQEFEQRPQKRYDDTELILAAFIENGFDSPRGKAAIDRMNEIHQRFHIANEDYLYILGTFIFEPYHWINRFGYRKTCKVEDEAGYVFWKEIGTRMGIENIPPSWDTFLKFTKEYEQANFAYSSGGRKVADAMLNLFMGRYLPRFLWPVLRPFIAALMDEPLRQTLQYPQPNKWIQRLAVGSLHMVGWVTRFLPARSQPKFRSTRKHPTYPKGYKIEELGPEDKNKN